MQKGGVNPIIFLLIILLLFFSVFLTGGLPKSTVKPSTDPTPVPQQVNVVPNAGKNGEQSLQIGSLGFVTLTPVPPTPTTAPKVTIDFGSASLDWDDILIAVEQGSKSSSSDLKPACKDELHKALAVEEGSNTTGAAPGTRLYLCAQNSACIQNGYGSYNGSTPLPVFTVSDECKKNIADVFYANIDQVKNDPRINAVYGPGFVHCILGDLKPPIYPNCDHTNGVCGRCSISGSVSGSAFRNAE